LTRIGKCDIGIVNSVARGGSSEVGRIEIGNKHTRQALHLRVIIDAPSNVNSNAIHVHFAIADRVEPGPGEGSLTILHARWNGKVELVDAVKAVSRRITALVGSSVGAGSTSVRSVEIERRVRGAASFDTVNDSPVFRQLDLRRIGLVGETELARSTAMNSSVEAIASVELKQL